MTIQIFGIPNCGSCKKAFQWFDRNGIPYGFTDIKAVAPGKDEIAEWVGALGFKVLRNTSGQSYRNLGEVKESWSDADWIEAFAADAMLIKRPVILKDGKAVLAGFRLEEKELRQIFLG